MEYLYHNSKARSQRELAETLLNKQGTMRPLA